MTFTLRPLQPPADYVHVARLVEMVVGHPASPERMAEWEWKRPEGTLEERLVAIDASGHVVGYSNATRIPQMPAGEFWLGIIVDTAVRGQGLGTQLAAAVEAFARAHGARKVVCNVADNDPTSLAIVERQGWRVDRQAFDSMLDVQTFDTDRFADAIPRAEAAGIRLFSLADDPSDAMKRRLYDLDSRTAVDMPGFSMDPQPYDDWHRMLCEGEGVSPAYVLLAAHGDDLVGYSRQVWREPPGHFWNRGTAVDRAWRGKGIALALKVLAVQVARAHGFPLMRTTNDSTNAPMLAINRKLGFQPAQGHYELTRNLT